MNILHISDFHLNQTTLRDWNDRLREAFFERLNKLKLESVEIDLVLITGDLIDKGGKDFGGAPEAFKIFNKEILSAITSELGLIPDNVMFIAGNHDVERIKDSELAEFGTRQLMNNVDKAKQKIHQLLSNADNEGVKRIEAYKNYEREHLSNFTAKNEIKGLGYFVDLSVNNFKVRVSGIDNSWRCWDNEDKGRLFIGVEQINFVTRNSENRDFKICLMHHPIDWIHESERTKVFARLQDKFDLILMGHTHEGQTSLQTNVYGSAFTHIAPSALNDIDSDSRRYANGFSIISLEPNKYLCRYYKFNSLKEEFVPDTDLGDDKGQLIIDRSKNDEEGTRTLTLRCLDVIREDHFELIDAHLIGSNIGSIGRDKSISERYVFPPIIQLDEYDDEDDQEEVSISELTGNNNNIVVFGDRQSGRTALLYRLVREYVDQFDFLKKVPVFIEFNELSKKSVSSLVRDYLRISQSEAKKLISENQLVLLIDEISYDSSNGDEYSARSLHRFNKENPNIKIIATGECETIGIVPDDFLRACTIPLKRFFIRRFRSKEIKSLMKIWLPQAKLDQIEGEKRLEKLVSSFQSYGLPSTAMSVSLFLWSTEYSDTEPINSAVLLEIYLEIMLEKIEGVNVYRKSFDFTNKVQLLANISYQIHQTDTGTNSLSYSSFLNCIEKYLENVGFEFDAGKIAEYFFQRKIFVKGRGNRVKFSNTCFYHFFLAKRMIFDVKFKESVLQSDVYYKYATEIDYYSGLSRSDESLLNFVNQELIQTFEPHEKIYQDVNLDKFFTPPKENPNESVQKIDIQSVKENRPSEKLIENFHDRRLESIPDPGGIIERQGNKSFSRVLLIASQVLRNSEGVENINLKQEVYERIIEYAQIWMVLHRESLIEYVLDFKKLPPGFPIELNFSLYLKNIPFFTQVGLSKNIGTSKLLAVVGKKVKKDHLNRNQISAIERFLSVSIYSDLYGSEFEKVLKRLIKTLPTNADNSIVNYYVLYKLMDYLYKRTKEGSPNEKMYLDLLAELKIRSQKLPKRLRMQIAKQYKEAKSKFEKRISENSKS